HAHPALAGGDNRRTFRHREVDRIARVAMMAEAAVVALADLEAAARPIRQAIDIAVVMLDTEVAAYPAQPIAVIPGLLRIRDLKPQQRHLLSRRQHPLGRHRPGRHQVVERQIDEESDREALPVHCVQLCSCRSRHRLDADLPVAAAFSGRRGGGEHQKRGGKQIMPGLGSRRARAADSRPGVAEKLQSLAAVIWRGNPRESSLSCKWSVPAGLWSRPQKRQHQLATWQKCEVYPDRLRRRRSEEHTSELQSRENLVCRLLLEKKKKRKVGTSKERTH